MAPRPRADIDPDMHLSFFALSYFQVLFSDVEWALTMNSEKRMNCAKLDAAQRFSKRRVFQRLNRDMDTDDDAFLRMIYISTQVFQKAAAIVVNLCSEQGYTDEAQKLDDKFEKLIRKTSLFVKSQQ